MDKLYVIITMGIPGFLKRILTFYGAESSDSQNPRTFTQVQMYNNAIKDLRKSGQTTQDRTFPYYFRQEDNKKTFFEIIDEIRYDYLMIDFSSLFHTIIEDVRDDVRKNREQISDNDLEPRIMEQIMLKTDSVISSLGSRKIYISMDGLCDIAKLESKRQWRYNSNLKRKYQKEFTTLFPMETIPREHIDKDEDLITWYMPDIFGDEKLFTGSPFMRNLEKNLRQLMAQDKYNDYTVFISGIEEPGEGEHKIFNCIRNIQGFFPDFLPGANICIYSNDADVVINSLFFDNNIYVVIENKTNSRNVFIPNLAHNLYKTIMYNIYLTILKSAEKEILQTIEEPVNGESSNLIFQIMQDFVFMTFFLGNDYLSCLPTMTVHEGGFEEIFTIYSKSFFQMNHDIVKQFSFEKLKTTLDLPKGKYRNLVYFYENETKIDQDFLISILNQFSWIEKKKLPKITEQKIFYSEKRSKYFPEPVLKNKWLWERSPYNPMFLNCRWDWGEIDISSVFKGSFEIIDYKTVDQGKDEYYKIYFDANTFEMKKECIENYLLGLKYLVKGYFDNDFDWNWHCPFSVSPFGFDIYKHLKKIDLRKLNLNKCRRISREEHLILTNPKSSFHWFMSDLNSSYQGLCQKILESEDDFFPDEEEIEWVVGDQIFLQNIYPRIPAMDIEILQKYGM